MEKKKFSAPYDTSVKIVSNIAIIISLLVLVNFAYNGLSSQTIAFGLIIIIVAAAWFIHPLGYELNEHEFRIKRPIGNTNISYENIQRVGYISREELGATVRLFACGWLFGYFGTYWSKDAGKFNMWCTNKDNMIIIQKKNGNVILISPSDPDGFVADLNDNLETEKYPNA